MQPMLKAIVFALVIGVLIFISCKKEYSRENCIGGNQPPIAIAGPDQVITLPIDSVSLDGNSSSDPDGTISEWLWTKISGPVSFNIIKPSDSITKVEALITGTYQFELKVKDNGGLFAKDTVQIIVNNPAQPNRPPVANAGPDQTITLPTNTANLDGSGSTDPDNNITRYEWTKISGPSSFNIVNANAVQTQATNLVQGVYQFELKVADGEGLVSKDTMLVNVSDTSSGQEFIFDGLTWELADFFGLGINDVFAGTPARPDLFNTIRQMEVSIKFDTASVWISVPYWTSGNSTPSPPLPPNNGYTYEFFNSILFVFAFPLNYQIVGSGVSIKVKFL